MNTMNVQVPTLLVIFNRPAKTRQVIQALRQVKPARLFVTADGPRPGHPQEQEACRQAREAAIAIDWPCDVKTKFLDRNLGCGPAVSSGINWFFEYVDKGIILEDDCLPHPDFFPYCQELLERYADDKRVMAICGLAPFPPREHSFDYHFSHHFYSGAWGTWRRAWKHYSYNLEGISEADFQEMARALYPSYFLRGPAVKRFKLAKKGLLTTWAFQWDVVRLAQSGLSIAPERNLITNIGYDRKATHRLNLNPNYANLKTYPLRFPLRHPPFVYADGRPLRSLQKAEYRYLSFKGRCSKQLRHIIGAIKDFWETMP